MADAVGGRRSLSQPERLLAALVYVAGFLILATYLNGQFLPAFGLSGLWFYSAFAALILGQFLVEPFFTRPADAIASAIAVLAAVASVDTTSAQAPQLVVVLWRYSFIVYAVLVLVLAVIAILAKDREGRVGSLAFEAAGVLGRSVVIFSLLLFGSGYVAFADDGGKLTALYFSWIAVFVAHPVEYIIRSARALRSSKKPDQLVVEGVRDPGLVSAKVAVGTNPAVGAAVRLRGTHESIGTVVDATSTIREGRVWIATSHGRELRSGIELETSQVDARPNVIGRVIDHSDLAVAVLQAGPSVADAQVEEGSLVELPIRGAQVMYQVFDVELATTHEDDLSRDVYHISARKLGRWDESSDRFVPVPWLPAPNVTAEVVHVEKAVFDGKYIGFVPATSFGVAIDIGPAITHNTAIIGILGVGKTHLAWELIGRALTDGVKVVALDITGKYTPRFRDVIAPIRSEDQMAARIEAAIKADFSNDTVRDSEAGNCRQFRSLVSAELEAFMSGPERMMVFNPNGFNVSRMEGNPFSGKANRLSRVTMVEVTQHIAEELLRFAQGLPTIELEQEPDADKARICLVLEEAHSLVPEWNSVTSPAEQLSTNATAKAILQGRKYGFGCLLITQRTANVTKSILNQCNTVVAMRIYDATGMGFLENYIGSGYAKLLATLRAQQAVVFGRGSSCDAPLIVELNNRDDYLKYWASQVPKLNDAMAPLPGPAAAEDLHNAPGPVPAVQGQGEDDVPHYAPAEPQEPDDIPF